MCHRLHTSRLAELPAKPTCSVPVPLVCDGFLNLQSSSDVLCWSFRSHSSEIQPLAPLPRRPCTNLPCLCRAPRREVEARPRGILSVATIPPGPWPLRCHLKKPGEPPSLSLPGESLGTPLTSAGLQGPPSGLRGQGQIFCRGFWLLSKASLGVHGCPRRSCRGSYKGWSGARLEPAWEKIPWQRERGPQAPAVLAALPAAAERPGPTRAWGSERVGMGHGGSGQVRPSARAFFRFQRD